MTTEQKIAEAFMLLREYRSVLELEKQHLISLLLTEQISNGEFSGRTMLVSTTINRINAVFK